MKEQKKICRNCERYKKPRSEIDPEDRSNPNKRMCILMGVLVDYHYSCRYFVKKK